MEALKKEIFATYSDIGKLISKENSSLSDLHKVHKILKTASESLQSYEKQNDKIFIQPPGVQSEPPNKKIKKQRFFSTKKKSSKSNANKLAKPTTEESEKIALSLVMNRNSNTSTIESEINNS